MSLRWLKRLNGGNFTWLNYTRANKPRRFRRLRRRLWGTPSEDGLDLGRSWMDQAFADLRRGLTDLANPSADH